MRYTLRMVRAGSFLALGLCTALWTVGFVACGAFTVEGDNNFGDGGSRTPVGSSGGSADGGRDATPGGSVTQDAAPEVDPACVLEQGPRFSAPCIDEKTGVFVAAGVVGGTGSKTDPYGKFADAIAAIGDKRFIFASEGEYVEDIVIAKNISIFGGLRRDFSGHDGLTTKVTGAGGKFVLDVSLGTEAMRFEDLTIVAKPDFDPGAVGLSSVPVFLHNVGSSAERVQLRRVSISAADGKGGASPAPSGVVGTHACGFLDADECCDGSDASVRGGAGGYAPFNGKDGARGGNAGGNGGGGGNCTPQVGFAASAAATGDAQAGGTNDSVGIDQTGLTVRFGSEGGTGVPGRGGGGGGGGYDGTTQGIGGSGGRASCGGRGGLGGGNGGLSVGLLSLSSFVELRDGTVVAARTGGAAGLGGAGGFANASPGSNGLGGATNCKGAKGGDGSPGQRGGQGGAGVAGRSIAVLMEGPQVLITDATMTFASNGDGAAGARRATIDAVSGVIAVLPE